MNCFFFSVTPQAKKAFYISISMVTMYILSGTIILMDYSADIFARTESSISAKSCSLYTSIAKFTGNVIFFVIVEQFSRKVCNWVLNFWFVFYSEMFSWHSNYQYFRVFLLDHQFCQPYFSFYLAHTAYYGWINRNLIGCRYFVVHVLVLAVQWAYLNCPSLLALKYFQKR